MPYQGSNLLKRPFPADTDDEFIPTTGHELVGVFYWGALWEEKGSGGE